MAGNATVVLQVNPYTLSGIDTTERSTVVEGQVLSLAGSIATGTIVAGGAGYSAGDYVQVVGGNSGIFKVATVTSGAAATLTLVNSGQNYAAVTGAATQALTGNGTGLTITTTINTNSGKIIQITGWSITSNVLTFTANNSLTTGGGDVITVQGFAGISGNPAAYTFLNGTYTVTSATATTIVVPLTHANGSGSQGGVAFVQGTYQTLGIPVSYSFVDQYGRQSPVATLGPLAVPKWIQFQSVAGSAFNYKINTQVFPNLLLIFNGVTQASDAAAITADTVTFRAEFNKNAF